MLNLAIGSAQQVDGRSCILTGKKAGHAVYGPYEMLDVGRYVVAFHIKDASEKVSNQDPLSAILDVAIDTGATILSTKRIYHSQLSGKLDLFALEFTLAEPARVEYRVWVSGHVPLLIEGHRRTTLVPSGVASVADLVTVNGFPEAGMDAPLFFRNNVQLFRALYEQGMHVSFQDNVTILSVAGVSLHVLSMDDLNFVGEIFQQNAYNLKAGRPVCVIDVGMNIGLTSLMLATKPEVVEVHAFEPFADTFDRASANLRLNPLLAEKISARNVGLSDKDWDGAIPIGHGPDSGSRSTIEVSDGKMVHLELNDAGLALRPIIEHARANTLAVVIKLDCEGSEFAILRSLERAGLLDSIDAFMVEWHAIFPEHSQETLLAPMRAAGFLIFDQSPTVGNGFFYAVRMA